MKVALVSKVLFIMHFHHTYTRLLVSNAFYARVLLTFHTTLK